MRIGVVSELVRTVSRFAIIGVVGGMAAACSSDSSRFSSTPFSNPFSSTAEADPHETGSVNAGAPAAVAPMARSSVQSAPLAPLQGRSASVGAPVYNRPVAAPTRTASGRMVPGWRIEGGTPVTVGQGDTIETISGRYGVPSTAILSANGMSAAQVTPGRQVVIPVYTVARAPAAAPLPVASAPVQDGRIVSRGKLADARAPRPETLQPRSLGEQAREPQPRLGHARRDLPVVHEAPARTAVAEPKVDAKSHMRPGRVAAGQPLPVKTAERKPSEAQLVGKVVKSEKLAVVREKPAKVAKLEPAKPERVADAPVKPVKAPVKVAAVEPARVVAPEPVKAAPAKEVEATASLPAQPSGPSADFRWPARGRVISGFGSSGSNEGINIAVPDGTPVKAAEAGTVAYAGSEVKGYGNLVLIRHDNGYVSAYAHNGELDVKRGQRVTRGQLIAKSGQSGNVTSPQLHFEIRKGATPVDPMPYLASN